MVRHVTLTHLYRFWFISSTFTAYAGDFLFHVYRFFPSALVLEFNPASLESILCALTHHWIYISCSRHLVYYQIYINILIYLYLYYNSATSGGGASMWGWGGMCPPDIFLKILFNKLFMGQILLAFQPKLRVLVRFRQNFQKISVQSLNQTDITSCNFSA